MGPTLSLDWLKGPFLAREWTSQYGLKEGVGRFLYLSTYPQRLSPIKPVQITPHRSQGIATYRKYFDTNK